MQKSSEIKWVTFDRHPNPSKMTSVGKISADVARIEMGEKGNMNDLLFRDPSSFRAAEIHKHIPVWERILENNPFKEQILQWLQYGVDVKKFIKPFKGTFKGSKYDSRFPPRKHLKIHQSCKLFTEFISKTLVERMRTGAVRVWGRVGTVEPPLGHLT